MVYLDPTKSFQSAASFMLLIGIVIPFVTTSLIGVLYENKWTMLTNSDLAGSNVKNALNLTVPGAILFVTGYSFLSYLNSLNADAIKIDRSFVLGLDQPEGQKVMAGLFNFAEALGLEVVVEGVETKEQLAKIPQNIGFSVQGWMYSKALAADEIPSFIQRYPSIH